MNDDQLLDIIFAKGRTSTRNEFPKFWPEVGEHNRPCSLSETDKKAAVAPGRPVRAVRNNVMREYDPRGKKGAWTKEEDKELLRYDQNISECPRQV